MDCLYLFCNLYQPCSPGHIRMGALDAQGRFLGSVSAGSLPMAQLLLRQLCWRVLAKRADRGLDPSRRLLARPPRGPHLALGPRELLSLRIRLARSRCGMSQLEAARRMEVSQQAYARLEGWGLNPTLETLLRLEEAFGKDVVALTWSGGVRR